MDKNKNKNDLAETGLGWPRAMGVITTTIHANDDPSGFSRVPRVIDG